MNEQLNEMLNQTQPSDPPVFSEADLDLPSEPAVEASTPDAAPEATPDEVPETPQNVIAITNFSDWIDENCEQFQNVNHPRTTIRGVNSDENIILAVDLPTATPEGSEFTRELYAFRDAKSVPVLNLPGSEMMVYSNNTFQIVHPYNDQIVIKTYGVRTGLICVFCVNHNNMKIPYAITKVKKKDEQIECNMTSIANLDQKLAAAADTEAILLLYKQFAKAENITSNLDALNWLLARQAEIKDINHLVQIDGVIIRMLA
jgi:hypothetical protein